MMIPKGYRAREAAGRNRKVRGRVDDEVRAQRASVLEPKIHKAIVATRDKHELKAVFEAAEKNPAAFAIASYRNCFSTSGGTFGSGVKSREKPWNNGFVFSARRVPS